MAAVACFTTTAAIYPAFSKELRVGGTGAVTEMLRQISPAFEAASGIALHVIPNLGTSGANAAAADGVLDLSISGRDLKQAEADKGLVIAATLRTPFGLVTSRPGPDNLVSAQIADLFRSDRPVWPDGAPIRIILRPANESDTGVVGALFPGMAEALKHLRARTDLSVAATDQDNAKMAETIKGSLVGATLTQITAEKRDLRFVSIDGVFPSLASFEDGSYPYGKTLYLVAPAAIGPEAAAFVSFITTPGGQALLRDAEIVAGTK